MENQFLISTYTWILNFRQKFFSKLAIRLIRGSTYMRVYTVTCLNLTLTNPTYPTMISIRTCTSD